MPSIHGRMEDVMVTLPLVSWWLEDPEFNSGLVHYLSCLCMLQLLDRIATCYKKLVVHSFWDPEVHHLRNFWVLCLSNSFGTPVRCFAGLCPLCVPFSFMFKPSWDKQLLELKIRVEWIKVICCCTLVLAMFMMPIEYLDSLLQSCILKTGRAGAAGWWGLGTSFACFSCSEPSEGNVGVSSP